MMQRTPDEMEAYIGRELKKLRLHRNTTQQQLASQAGVSLGALKSLESGRGCTLKTLVSILKALDRDSWIETIAPIPAINPLVMTLDAKPRQRAASRGSGSQQLPPTPDHAYSTTPTVVQAIDINHSTALSATQRAGMSLQELAKYNSGTSALNAGNKK